MYDTKINVSALYVVFETNMFETIDFLKTFINGYIIILFLVVLCYYSLKTIYVQYPYKNILLETYNSYNDYNAFKAIMKNTLAQETTDNINVFKDTEKEETYV